MNIVWGLATDWATDFVPEFVKKLIRRREQRKETERMKLVETVARAIAETRKKNGETDPSWSIVNYWLQWRISNASGLLQKKNSATSGVRKLHPVVQIRSFTEEAISAYFIDFTDSCVKLQNYDRDCAAKAKETGGIVYANDPDRNVWVCVRNIKEVKYSDLHAAALKLAISGS